MFLPHGTLNQPAFPWQNITEVTEQLGLGLQMCLAVSGELCLLALSDGHLKTSTLEDLLGEGRA